MTRVTVEQMIDITAPEQEVEIIIGPLDRGKHVIWVNVDGICRLRICQVPNEILKLDDRTGEGDDSDV